MGSPICTKDWSPVNWGSAVCDLLRGLLLTNEKLATFWKWMWGDDCKLTPEFGKELVDLLAPIGSGFWAPVELRNLDPEVWVKCSGQSLDKAGVYAKLYEALGKPDDPDDDRKFIMPKLSGRMLMVEGRREDGDGSADPPIEATDMFTVGEQDGVEEIELTVENLGPHKHGTAIPKPGTSDPNQYFPLDYVDDSASTDTNKVLPVGYSVDQFTALEQTGGIPGNIYKADQYNRFDKIYYHTTEPIPELSRIGGDGDDKDDPVKGEPHTNMPPYHVGVYYMRANHKINGKLIDPPAEE